MLIRIAALAVCALVVACANEDAADHPDCGPDCFEVVFVGDILLGDAAQPLLEERGYTYPFDRVRDLVAGDYLVGNVEGPITARGGRHFDDQRWSYNARPEAAAALAEEGFDAAGLANNHAFDRGPEGLLDTVRHLEEAGVRAFGAGADLDEAARPIFIDTPHGRMAVVALANWRFGQEATTDRPGAVRLTYTAMLRGRELALAGGAEYVVAFVHWGENYSGITLQQRSLARALSRFGYDLVIGAHPHVAQPVEVVEGMPVVYSLGNFTFGTPGRFSESQPGYGLVARLQLDAEGPAALLLDCIVTDNEVVQFQPRPCDETEAREVIDGLGSEVRWRGGRGVLALR